MMMFSPSGVPVNDRNNERPVLACYYGTWAKWDGLTPGEIPANLCTHIIVAYADVTVSPPGIRLHDPLDDTRVLPKLRTLREYNPGLKLLISVGGWNHGTTRFTQVASDPRKLLAFARNVTTFVRERDLDGVDIAWEFPSNANLFTSFLQALRQQIVSERPGSSCLLTTAVSADVAIIKLSYDVPALNRLLDLVLVMAYDYHGVWDGRTGHNSPLYSQWQPTQTVNFSTTYWLHAGLSAQKIVLGVPTYGRYFRLVTRGEIGVGARAEPWTWPLSDPYHTICANELYHLNHHWDPLARAPYATDGVIWLSYDNVTSITHKAQYAREAGLRGVFVWSIDQDDFTGKCKHGMFPLTNAVRQVIIGNVSPTGPSSTTTSATTTTTVYPGVSSSSSRESITRAITRSSDTPTLTGVAVTVPLPSRQSPSETDTPVTPASRPAATRRTNAAIKIPESRKSSTTTSTKQGGSQIRSPTAAITVQPPPDWSRKEWLCMGVRSAIPSCSQADPHDSYIVIPCRCEFFIHCDNGRTHLKICPGALVFDMASQRCDYRWETSRRDCYGRR